MSDPASAFGPLGLSDETIKLLTTPKPPPAEAASPNVLEASTTGQQVAPGESSITLYAELLLHIRTVTLFASLKSSHAHETKANLSSEGCEVTITHEGERATIRLPVKATGGGDAALSFPASPSSKELTLRLQIEEQEGSDFLRGDLAELRKLNIVPWDGASLNEREKVEVRCKSCSTVVVAEGEVREWRDLPNENWAEMMDFWHCHKPDEHHLHDHTHEEHMEKKGYAAGNKLAAQEGIGFVDLTSFLLFPRDCEGAEISGEDSVLVCKHCKHTLGTTDEQASGWRIWKWCISIPSTSSSGSSSALHDSSPRISTYSVQKWISARLLYLIENSGLRKFQVYSFTNTTPSGTVPSLLLWVFTPDLIFSSSLPSEDRRDPTRALKVFYQAQEYTPSRDGAQASSTVEEVEFPEELYKELGWELVKSQALLPMGARQFQGWEVGLLGRFDPAEVI
ncbi:ubiquitin-conjugating enzyme E2-binding protein [Lophiotrema nucula]|uniref:Ubiquitin-conjugating enzyme E2-binding protein n=1 Tax=Lophiotrema nucula TaxID=690887 RepID=A0A6A5YTN1_9PLEO|nr:ubiquitin-conjugating enzyme E2-binding protein [Lophiotrema nucula]